MNGDRNASDLMYIPKSKDEVQFIDAINTKTGEVMMTAQAQQDAFWEFVNTNPYLKKNKGKYAQRFGYVEPWYNRWDFKFLQDVYTNFGSDRRYTLQISLDILNVGNLLCKDWGVYQTMGSQSYDRIRPLTQAKSFDSDSKGGWSQKTGLNADNSISYILNANSVEAFKSSNTWKNSTTTSSTWGMLLGIRLLF